MKSSYKNEIGKLYILLQLTGWLLYVLLAFMFGISRNEPNINQLISTLLIIYIVGVLLTHLYRFYIIKNGWSLLNIYVLIPNVLSAVILLSFIYEFFFTLGRMLLYHQSKSFSMVDHFGNILNWGFLLVMWSLLYFSYQFFERYRTGEIKNLKWEAMRNEIELNQLKAQLNPHFIFNSMNSIRSLIEEDPNKAKRSITQLANILRSTLIMSQSKTVSFENEMSIVHDFIELEKTRYEERLHYREEIDPHTLSIKIPSLMVQTLIENGIKHGISKLPKGGEVIIRTKIKDEMLNLSIENTGELHINIRSETGIGILNTQQRLHLLYGEKATFKIFNTNYHTVITHITLPIKP